MIPTEHAFKRGKERLNWSREALEKLSGRAYIMGVTSKEVSGPLRKWMKRKEETRLQVKLYGEVVYVFSDHVLVTLYRVPNELRKYLKELI